VNRIDSGWEKEIDTSAAKSVSNPTKRSMARRLKPYAKNSACRNVNANWMSVGKQDV